MPAPRMRFAAGVYGHYLIVYSGHGDVPIPKRERHLRLDLRTLHWSRVQPRNSPVSLVNTPAATMCSGVIAGGVQMSAFMGIRPVPKFDLLLLAEPPEAMSTPSQGPAHAGSSSQTAREQDATLSELHEWEGAPRMFSEPAGASNSRLTPTGGEDSSESESDDSDDDDDDGDKGVSKLVSVEVTDADGVQRTLRLPLSLLAAMMRARHAGGDAEEGEEDDKEDEEEVDQAGNSPSAQDDATGEAD